MTLDQLGILAAGVALAAGPVAMLVIRSRERRSGAENGSAAPEIEEEGRTLDP